MVDGFQSLQSTPDQSLALLKADPKALIIDVREKWEWDEEHLPHSILISLSHAKPSDFDRFPKDQQLLILCAHGNRSMGVTQFLREKGFTNVKSMSGGISIIPPSMREEFGKLLAGRTHA